MGAGQWIHFVDFLDQPSPSGAALSGRCGQVALVLIGQTDTQGWLSRMVVSPTLGCKAQEVRCASPSASSTRGVQAVAANQSVTCVRQVLELGKECGGRKDL